MQPQATAGQPHALATCSSTEMPSKTRYSVKRGSSGPISKMGLTQRGEGPTTGSNFMPPCRRARGVARARGRGDVRVSGGKRNGWRLHARRERRARAWQARCAIEAAGEWSARGRCEATMGPRGQEGQQPAGAHLDDGALEFEEAAHLNGAAERDLAVALGTHARTHSRTHAAKGHVSRG